MIEDYLTGSIAQSQERVRQLSQIVQGQYPREYDGLRQICLSRLDDISRDYDRLQRESIVDTSLQTPRRIRQLKRINEELILTESVGVFALSRARSDDDFLNRLITDICRDIAYPLVVPTVSQMSQGYFHIYPDFNLLCMPLIEGRFLLHLPDIYHELCHPFRRRRNIQLPRLEAFQNAYDNCLFAAFYYFKTLTVEAERLRSPAGTMLHLQLWQTCWIKYWMEEVFCDLFGVLTVGPAYGWAHFHLCVERGGDLFDTPMGLSSSHPADAARMNAILTMLKRLGFHDEEQKIATAWKEFEDMTGAAQNPEYRQCYGDSLLTEIVSEVQAGVSKIGVTVVSPTNMTPTVTLLNEAWIKFWGAPSDYAEWESGQIEALRANRDASHP